MDKETEYEEINVKVDDTEYTVSFIATEVWNYIDHGIGPYEYWGAFGIHEDWQWELETVEITDIFVHEYLNEHGLNMKTSIDGLNKDFADKLLKVCDKYAYDNAEEPERDGDYYDDNFDDGPWPDPGYYHYSD
jgi:hypothetical protein